MLELSDIDVAYGESQVIFGVDLHVNEGEFVAMIGPNGAGKSTLFKTISGNMTPKAGTIDYRGNSIVGMDPHEITQLGISHVPQDDSLFTGLTVIDNLRVGSFMKDVRDQREENMDLVFDIFPRLEERRDQIAGTLSGGERRMLAVAKGLMSDPDLLMLDEPSAGLAPNLVDLVFQRIEQIREETGTTVFLVEQRVLESLDIAERAYVLENGRIEMTGPTDELRSQDEIQEAYLGL
ncbi:ABC transporter ATP-binding protein [Natronosalvus halobius]|uniref:ABC transporter ATP-binding protein n=1 Tax=Natronosalvus halobius TaxID=2953746 RepID=UPI00209D07F6|nr:ABC transporter ATP-binding protein [Natronosalvus halobius]USZ73583.1 ABC transporter ATP-binding protein [Natronosalvus halobius]